MPVLKTYDCINCRQTVTKANTRGKYCSIKCQKADERKPLIQGLVNGDYVGKKLDFKENHNKKGSGTSWAKAFLNNWYDNTCQECGISNYWNGIPLTLQVDHIDGDALNNDIENLSLLCPNCHTQTNTWGNKRGKGASARTWRYKNNA